MKQDFTTFEITGVDPNHPRRLSFQQIGNHSSADCTNPHIENALLDHIRRELRLPLKSGDVARLAVEAARAAKERYNGRGNVTVTLPIAWDYLQRRYAGGCDSFNFDDREFTFSASVLQKAMDSVVTDVLGRIKDQARSCGANKIAIVGGLSCSRYFQRRIEADFANIPEVSHLLPVNYFDGYDPWVALLSSLPNRANRESQDDNCFTRFDPYRECPKPYAV